MSYTTDWRRECDRCEDRGYRNGREGRWMFLLVGLLIGAFFF